MIKTCYFGENCEKQMEISQGLLPKKLQEKHQDEI
jgi:hypothetical protein